MRSLSLSPISNRTHRKGRNCSEEFKAHHAVVAAQLRYHGKYVINPRGSRWIPYWDACSTAFLLYTALVTPVEVCLFKDTSLASGMGMVVLFALNRATDVFFFMDLVLNFFMAYQETPSEGGRWVTDLAQIRGHYLRTWFFVDVLSMLPFDTLTQIGLLSSQSTMLRLVRTIRLLRLIKLLRILRASRILARWKSFLGISYSSLTMFKLFAATFFMVHIFACAWSWVGLNWEGTEGSSLSWERTWIDAYDFEISRMGGHRLYVIALYIAVVAMFGGVSNLTPSNYVEYCVYTLMMLVGSMMWAWVIGSLCGMLATLNPQATAYQNQMDELEYFMKERQFAHRHRARLRDFFRQTEEYLRLSSHNALMAKMSVQLRGDTALLIGIATLEKVSYFSLDSVEKEFLAVVALNLYGAVYEAREVLPFVDLTVIAKGMAARKLRIFSKGATLGTDCVIPDARQNLRELDTANCLSFVQTSQISRHSLITIVEHFPVAKAHVRTAGILFALRAAFRQYYKAYKAEETRTMSDPGDSFTALRAEGSRSFAGRSRARMDIARGKHRRQSIALDDILASVERAKDSKDSGKDAASFNTKQRQLRVRGFGVGGAGGEMLDGAGSDELLGLVRSELGEVRKGQELAAKRSSDLIARNEVLDIRCGTLDDKLELILSLLTSMRGSPLTSAEGGKANGASPAEHPGRMSINGEGGQELRRRRKTIKNATNAALVGMRASRNSASSLCDVAAAAAAANGGAANGGTANGGTANGGTANGAVGASNAQQAAGAGGGHLLGLLNGMSVLPPRAAHQAERAELRAALSLEA